MTRCLSRSATLSSSVIRCTWDASRPALSASASAFRLCSLRSPRSDPAAAMAWNSLQNNVQVRTLLARGGAGREITPEGRHPRGGHPRPVEPRQDDLGPDSRPHMPRMSLGAPASRLDSQLHYGGRQHGRSHAFSSQKRPKAPPASAAGERPQPGAGCRHAEISKEPLLGVPLRRPRRR